MKNKFTIEIVLAIVLAGLLIILANPGDIFMPNMFQMMLSGVAVVVFGFFASLVLREHAGDEREEKNRGFAGRLGFLAGSAVILVGILIQVHMGHLDVWLVGALVAMIVAKIGARIYSEERF